MWKILAQAAPNAPAVQHIAPVANDVNWWIIALSIAGATAMFTFGFSKVIRFAIQGSEREGVYEVIARAILVAICTAAGGIAGWRSWDPWLGGLAGMVGSGASTTIMYYLNKIFSRFAAGNGSNRPPAA